MSPVMAIIVGPVCCYRFLLMRVLGRDAPKGIAISKALITLANQARAQGAYKLARFVYSRLQVGW